MVKKILQSFGHSVLLIVLHIFYFNLNWSVPLEYEMMMAMNKVESFTGGHGRFDEDKYLFINTAYDVSLAQTETEYGDNGQIAVTDRLMLAEFFDKLVEFGNNHKYILCDIFFREHADNDSALSESFSKVSKIILPAEYDNEQKQLIRPIFNVKSAQADYITYEGLVSKIRLYAKESNSKTLPMIMYEDCNHIQTKVTNLGLLYKGKYIPLSVYPRYFFNRSSMRKQEFRLKTIVDLLKKNGGLFYDDYIRNRIIVIGNFTNDRHPTFIGYMPGSLVLFNTYLTMQARYHLLGWSWFVFALISFAILSYIEFVYKKQRPSITDKSWRRLFLHLLGVTGWCIIISFLSGLIFRVHITIIPVIIYLEIFRHLGKIKLLQIKKV